MFKYLLATSDGDLIDTYESVRSDWRPGDEFIGHRNTRWRITAIVPRDRIAEFHDAPEHELWEVEHLQRKETRAKARRMGE